MSGCGTVVHDLPGGVRLLESAGLIELLGEPRDEALEQLVTVAQRRFGTKRLTPLSTSRPISSVTNALRVLNDFRMSVGSVYTHT